MFFRKMIDTYRLEEEFFDFMDKLQKEGVTVEDLKNGEPEELYRELVEFVESYEELIENPYREMSFHEMEIHPFRSGARLVLNRKMKVRTALGIFIGGWLCAFRYLPTYLRQSSYFNQEEVYPPDEDPRNWSRN